MQFADASPAASGDGLDTPGRCSACAACSVAAAPLTDGPAVARAEPGRSTGRVSVPDFESAVLDTPHPPPRDLLG